jgi:hypothetical protein
LATALCQKLLSRSSGSIEDRLLLRNLLLELSAKLGIARQNGGDFEDEL